MTKKRRSRREFIKQAVSVTGMIALGSANIRADLTQITLASPNGQIHFELVPDSQKLRYLITLDNRRAIDWSKLSMIVDGVVITDRADIRKVERFQVREKLPTRGVHSTMYRGKVWTMRMFAGFGTAEETNARFKYLLEHGETGLSTAFDLPRGALRS